MDNGHLIWHSYRYDADKDAFYVALKAISFGRKRTDNYTLSIVPAGNTEITAARWILISLFLLRLMTA